MTQEFDSKRFYDLYVAFMQRCDINRQSQFTIEEIKKLTDNLSFKKMEIG